MKKVAKQAEKAKAGRPMKEPQAIGKREAKELARMARAGATDEELAESLGISRGTLRARLAAAGPAISATIKEAKDAADADVEQALFELATGYSCPEERVTTDGTTVTITRRYPPNVTACIFWLKNRKPKEWRDRVELEHSGAVDLVAHLAAARARASIAQ